MVYIQHDSLPLRPFAVFRPCIEHPRKIARQE
jgi:hypothetical protein